MQKKLFLILAAVVGAVGFIQNLYACCEDNYNNGIYMGAELGYAADDLGEGGGGRLLVGDQWNPYSAIEIAGTAIPNADSDFWANPYRGKFYSLDADIKLILPMTHRFDFYLRAGPSVGYIDESVLIARRDGYKAMVNAGTGLDVNFDRHLTAEVFFQAIGQPSDTGVVVGLAGIGLTYHFSDDNNNNSAKSITESKNNTPPE